LQLGRAQLQALSVLRHDPRTHAAPHPNPARYLPGFHAARIQTLEIETARQSGEPCKRLPSKTEYLRELREIVGWDLGQDATLSFVECAGGDVARAFHGRPMCLGNPKARIGRAS